MKIEFTLPKPKAPDLILADRMEAEALTIKNHIEQKAIEQSRLDSRLTVPLTLKGVLAGTCHIYPDGTIEAEVGQGKLGQELRRLLLDGVANCLSIGPNPKGPIVPEVEPLTPDTNKLYDRRLTKLDLSKETKND